MVKPLFSSLIHIPEIRMFISANHSHNLEIKLMGEIFEIQPIVIKVGMEAFLNISLSKKKVLLSVL